MHEKSRSMPSQFKQKEILIVEYGSTVPELMLPENLNDSRPCTLVVDPEVVNSNNIKVISKIVGQKAIISQSNNDIWLPFDRNDNNVLYACNRSGAYYIGLVGLAKKEAGIEKVDDEQAIVVSQSEVVKSFLKHNPNGVHNTKMRLEGDNESDRPIAEYIIRVLGKACR